MINLVLLLSLMLCGAYYYRTKDKTKIETLVTATKDHSKTVGIACAQGRRPTMEDAHCHHINDKYALFGIFDGHGGKQVADFAALNMQKNYENMSNTTGFLFDSISMDINYQHKAFNIDDLSGDFLALSKAFIKTHLNLDKSGIDSNEQGCTAIVALIKDKKLFIANAGDSRAVLSNNNVAIPLSTDHKPNRPDEQKRIEDLGGQIIKYGVARVNGLLAVSRAIGDKKLNPWVTPVPEVFSYEIEAKDDFLILACDGVWDVLSNQNAVDVVKYALDNNNNDFTIAAEALKDAALKARSTDNVSVMVIDLKKFK